MKRKLLKMMLSAIAVFSILSASVAVYAQSDETNQPSSSNNNRNYLEGEFLGDSGNYELGRGDRVTILVRNQPDFSGNYVIGPDGKIQFPFIDDIQAEGLTKLALKDELVLLLEKYIKFPEVHIMVDEYRSKYIYILGEVGNPGKYNIAGDTIPLRDAIMDAGLHTRDANLANVYVIKPDDSDPIKKKINLKKILYKGILRDNVSLVPGDLVVVSTKKWTALSRYIAYLLDPIVRIAIVEDLVDDFND